MLRILHDLHGPWSTPCLSTSGGVCVECPDGGEMLSGWWHWCWTWTHSVSASVTWSPLTQTSLELGWCLQSAVWRPGSCTNTTSPRSSQPISSILIFKRLKTKQNLLVKCPEIQIGIVQDCKCGLWMWMEKPSVNVSVYEHTCNTYIELLI